MQSFESVPTWFSNYLGISLEASQAILSICIIFAFLLPILYFNRDRSGFLVELVFILFLEAFLVGIEWCPSWLLIATVALMAAGIAIFGTKLVTGE